MTSIESELHRDLQKAQAALITKTNDFHYRGAVITRMRHALSLVTACLRNGSAASPEASLDFLCDAVPKEVLLYCDVLRRRLREVHQAHTQPEWLAERLARNPAYLTELDAEVQQLISPKDVTDQATKKFKL